MSIHMQFPSRRLKSLLLALAIALPAGLAIVVLPALAVAEEEEDEGGGRSVRAQPVAQTAADKAAIAAWKTECGSCHIPFPASRLPAKSWQKLMGNLGDHFGSDASLGDAAVTKQISDWLVKNAGDPARTVAAKGAAVPLRITDTRWFIRQHDEVGANVWKRPSIKSAANCGACHQGAADGNFDEDNVRIPKK